MKYLLLLLYAIPCLAQKKTFTVQDLPYPIDSVTNKVSYVGVVQVPGATADQLFIRAKDYMIKAYKDSSLVIQVSSRAGGLLDGKGIVRVVKNPSAFMELSMELVVPLELLFKEGRFRYEITDLMRVGDSPTDLIPFDGETYENMRNTKPTKRYTQSQLDFANQINRVLVNFIGELTRALKKPDF